MMKYKLSLVFFVLALVSAACGALDAPAKESVAPIVNYTATDINGVPVDAVGAYSAIVTNPNTGGTLVRLEYWVLDDFSFFGNIEAWMHTSRCVTVSNDVIEIHIFAHQGFEWVEHPHDGVKDWCLEKK